MGPQLTPTKPTYVFLNLTAPSMISSYIHLPLILFVSFLRSLSISFTSEFQRNVINYSTSDTNTKLLVLDSRFSGILILSTSSSLVDQPMTFFCTFLVIF